MELANIFLDTDEGKVKLTYDSLPQPRCQGVGKHVLEAARYFLNVLDNFIIIEYSSFYMAIRDQDMFYFYCDRGTISPVQEFFVFDRMFVFSGEAGTVRGVVFVVTDQFPIEIRTRRRISLQVYSDNTRFYGR